MKVDVNSWHYRMVCRMNMTPSKSLCVYFWQAVWCTFMLCLVFPAILLFMLVGAVAFAPIPLGDFILWVFGAGVNIDGLNSYLLRLGVGYAAIILMFVFWILCAYWEERRIKIVEKKEDGIFVSYVKAKKSKICPIIEFTDGDEDES